MSIVGTRALVKQIMLLNIEHVPIKTKMQYLYEISREEKSIETEEVH